MTRPTAHKAIDALVECGDLVDVTGRERGRIYEAPRILDAVYGSVDIDGGETPCHSSISVTLDVYSGVLPNMQREAVERRADASDTR